MAADPPLTQLALAAASVADDLGFAALADLRTALGDEAEDDYRIIGGHMVTVLAARWQLGAGLYRATGDADLGVSELVLKSLATWVRVKDTDVTDICRCQEVGPCSPPVHEPGRGGRHRPGCAPARTGGNRPARRMSPMTMSAGQMNRHTSPHGSNHPAEVMCARQRSPDHGGGR